MARAAQRPERDAQAVDVLTLALLVVCLHVETNQMSPDEYWFTPFGLGVCSGGH